MENNTNEAMKINWDEKKTVEQIPYEAGKLYKVEQFIKNDKKITAFGVPVEKIQINGKITYKVIKYGNHLLFLRTRTAKINDRILKNEQIYYEFLFGDEIILVPHFLAKEHIPPVKQNVFSEL